MPLPEDGEQDDPMRDGDEESGSMPKQTGGTKGEVARDVENVGNGSCAKGDDGVHLRVEVWQGKHCHGQVSACCDRSNTWSVISNAIIHGTNLFLDATYIPGLLHRWNSKGTSSCACVKRCKTPPRTGGPNTSSTVGTVMSVCPTTSRISCLRPRQEVHREVVGIS